MAGYSYFNYDQMTLLEVEVHSKQLELLKQAADDYYWEGIRAEVGPLFNGNFAYKAKFPSLKA